MVSSIQVMAKVNYSHSIHEAQMGCKFIAPLGRRIVNTCEWSTSLSSLFTYEIKLRYPLQWRFLYFCAPTIDSNAFPTRVTRALHIQIVLLIINLQILGGNLKTWGYYSRVR
jgi:hypothetical protein